MRLIHTLPFLTILACGSPYVPPTMGPEPTGLLEFSATSLTLEETSPPELVGLNLAIPPNSDVTFTITSLDPSIATVEPAELTFTVENYDAPQIFTVTPVADNTAGGVRSTEIRLVIGSEDARYAKQLSASVQVAINDDDVAAQVVLGAQGAPEVGEDGETLEIAATLSQQPTADVLLPVLSSDKTQGTVSPETLTFTALNWNLPQTIVVTGVDDKKRDVGTMFDITVGPSNSTDAAFNNLAATRLSVLSVDGVCGNDIVDGEEACEPSDAPLAACEYGMRMCEPECTNECEALERPSPGFCGDGEIQDPQEACDGAALQGETCQTIGAFASGTLRCNSACDGYDTSQCSDEPSGDLPANACLLISEYIEGAQRDKAIEVYNCGNTTLPLSKVTMCVITNQNSSCSTSFQLSGGLPPGEVHVACNQMFTQGNSLCDTLTGRLDFNGDDRIVIYADTNGNGTLETNEPPLDVFGNIRMAPPTDGGDRAWQDKGYARKNCNRHDGSAFDTFNYYDTLAFGDHSGLGQPPNINCR